MPAVHIDRLDLTLSGIDPAIAAAALQAFPRLLAEQLARDRTIAHHPDAATIRLPAHPTAAALADHLAGHVAAQVRSQTRIPDVPRRD